MRLAVIFLIACAAFISHVESAVVLFPVKENMVGQDYINRANYMSALTNADYTYFTVSNTTQAGPFNFHLLFAAPYGGIESPYPNFGDIYSLTLSAIMETNVPETSSRLPPNRRRRLETAYVWDTIDITGKLEQNGGSLGYPYEVYEFIYGISIPDLESKWIKTDLTTKWKFSTVFKFFFNATENGGNELNLLIQCPVTLTRPKTVSGSYSSTEVTSLTSTAAGQVDIDLSITATLLPCVDALNADPTSCTRKTDSDPDPVYKLNDIAKFELFLDNSDFAGVYYLIKNTIQLKTDAMMGSVDFSAAATAGPVNKGYMTFVLPMAIVGDPITVSAIATLSTTATSRRMMASGAAKATAASSTVGVSTGAAKSTVSGLSSYIMSLVLFFGIVLIML